MKLSLLIWACIGCCTARPQDILFATLSPDCGVNRVDVDGTCYLKGEQGPCSPGQFIWATEQNPHPVCISKESDGNTSGALVQAVSVGETEVVDCANDAILWDDGNCYQLNTRGPCQEGSWLVLDSVEGEEAVFKCQERRCQDEDVWWPETCSCRKLGSLDECGTDEAVAVGPYGEGICASTLGDRILDLIPTNEEPDRKCHVDENGVCRRILRIKKLRKRGEFGTFVDWLAGFSPRTNTDESGDCVPVPQCENDTLAWEDGRCYELTTQGPCDDGSWLVLQAGNGAQSRMICETRRCSEGEAWWPETCSCVKLGSSEECDGDEIVATGPYGEGVCSKADRPRILDLIPTNEDSEVGRRFCHVDENGTCRRIINIRNLRRRAGFEDWLGEFSLRTTTDESGVCIPSRQCLGDSLPWTDGKCYQLASRGPCEAGSWLVLDGIKNGRPVMKCELQKCEDGQVWWPETCSCLGRGRSDVCPDGKKIAVGPYGEGVCANLVGERILDLIPTNEDDDQEEAGCHVDENGTCRRVIKVNVLRNTARGQFEDFVEWLGDFRKRTQSDESGRCVENERPLFEEGPLCDNDTLPWVDGQCYQLNTQGPCNDERWLVLKGVIGDEAVMTCGVRRCQEGEAWWPESCSCLKLGSRDVCGQDETVAMGPYGEGVCARANGDRILDLIPTNEHSSTGNSSGRTGCHVDENGTCRRIIKIGKLRTRQDFDTFVDWLRGFSPRSKSNDCLLNTN